MIRKLKSYLPIPVAILIVIILTWVAYSKFSLFFSNHGELYTGFVTLFVGLFAVWLYIKQKQDFKRDTAAALLTEIRFAERALRKLKEHSPKLDTSITILPSNTWVKYSYLFADELDRDELDLIHEFYSDCKIIEKAVEQLDIGKQLDDKAHFIQGTLAHLATLAIDVSDYENKKKSFLELFSVGESYTFPPLGPQERLLSVLNRIVFISTTTAGDKLKKIVKS